MSARRFTIALLFVSACSGASQGPGQNPIEATPAPKTEAVLVGPLCKGDECACKTGDGDAGAPEAGSKRFEFRVGPSDDPLWVTVDGMVMFKSRDRSDACWYVDLVPGEHQVSLRGQAEGGLNIALSVAEQGGQGASTWWYRTFDFNCGAPGECATSDVQAWKEEVAKLEGKHDPCGSTKVQKIEWETGRMPDRLHPDDLLLRATLNVYKFVPPHPPGSSECDKAGGGLGEPAAPAADPSAPAPGAP